MNRLIKPKLVEEVETPAPRFAFGEMSGTHLIYRPQNPRKHLRLVASQEVQTCQNP